MKPDWKQAALGASEATVDFNNNALTALAANWNDLTAGNHSVSQLTSVNCRGNKLTSLTARGVYNEASEFGVGTTSQFVWMNPSSPPYFLPYLTSLDLSLNPLNVPVKEASPGSRALLFEPISRGNEPQDPGTQDAP